MSKVVLVTGGAKRIGKSICKKFHENEFSIVCHYNSSEDEANNLKESLNSIRKDSVEIVQFDLNDINKYGSFCESVIKKFGRVDVLINNASSFYSTPIFDNRQDAWDDLINSNVKGPHEIIKNLKKNLKENLGVIINLSDAMIIRGMKDYSIYSIAKGGLETLTKSLAKELAPEIRVNAVAPGAILLPTDGSSNEEKLISTIPLGRIGNEEDISSAVFHLYKNEYITGQILRVDGGRSLN